MADNLVLKVLQVLRVQQEVLQVLRVLLEILVRQVPQVSAVLQVPQVRRVLLGLLATASFRSTPRLAVEVRVFLQVPLIISWRSQRVAEGEAAEQEVPIPILPQAEAEAVQA
jgi:hypothetical protein